MNINKILLYRMKTHKRKDYKLSPVEYYLSEDNTQENISNIFQCSPKKFNALGRAIRIRRRNITKE